MSVTLLAASADDSRLAYIHGGRLVLCDARALTELGATDAPEGARQLLFIGPPSRLLVATDDELFTYELATMTVLGRRTVASGARVATVLDNRAVLWLAGGSAIALARFQDDAIDVHALDTSSPPVDVAPLEQAQVLIVTAHRNEVLDLTSRRVVARLHLPLPAAPRLLGPSGGLRFLWTASVGGRELVIIRLSDGRSTTTIVPAPIRHVLTAATSSWLCVQTDDGLFRVHVVTQAAHRLDDVDLGRGACVGGAADAGLYWIDASWRLRRTSLAGDAVVATAGGPLRLAFAGMDDRDVPAGSGPSTTGGPAAPTATLAAPAPLGAPISQAATLAPPGALAVPAVVMSASVPAPPAFAAAAPLGLAQLEPSAPMPAMPLADAAPMFVDPPPVRPAAWTAPLVAADPINAMPTTVPPPVMPVVSEPPSGRAPSRLDERVRRAGMRAARADGDGDLAPPRPITYASPAATAPPTPAAPPAPAEIATDDAPPRSGFEPARAIAADDVDDDRSAAPRPSLPPMASTAPEGFAGEVAEEAATGELADGSPAIAPGLSGLTADARPVRSWRLQCATWARQVLRGRDALEPSFVGTPLGLLARRAHLDPDGARALSLLYGAWLLGRPAQALARVGRMVLWDELAGRGTLPEAGLHTVRAGRAALRSTVARFLDGARARHMVVHGLRPRSNLAAGRQLVRCSPDVPIQAAARAVAEHLGAAAIIDERGARGRQQLAIALDEAWLRALPAVVVPGADLDASAIAAVRLRRDHALVVLWPDRVVPMPLEELPILEL